MARKFISRSRARAINFCLDNFSHFKIATASRRNAAQVDHELSDRRVDHCQGFVTAHKMVGLSLRSLLDRFGSSKAKPIVSSVRAARAEALNVSQAAGVDPGGAIDYPLGL
ncbi:MAG: hypothetical protein WA322_24410 [Pseudolabrys sp.]